MKKIIALGLVLCGVAIGSVMAAETKGAAKQDAAAAAQEQAPVTYAKAKGVPADMIFKLDEKGGFAIPEWCEAWFDGCNNCHFKTHMGQMIGACSSRGCKPEEMKEPHCTKRRKEAKK